MNKLKINRKHFISLDNIEKIVVKKDGKFGHDVWVYAKSGFPKIYKCLEGIDILKNRLVNLGCTIHDFKVEEK